MSENSEHHEDSRILIECIKEEDFLTVKELLEKLKLTDDVHLNTEYPESPVLVAIQYAKLDIYDLLLSHGYRLRNDESLFGIHLTTKEVKKLHEINKKYFVEVRSELLTVLISRSNLKHEEPFENRMKYEKCITKALEELSNMEETEPVLKILSTCEELKIVFDFYRDSLVDLDPEFQCARGIFYPEVMHIYVGAKGLQSEEENDFYQALGTLAHETCHFAMHLLYDNKCKPYIESEGECSNFADILEKTAKAAAKKKEEIIQEALNEKEKKEDKQHAELIVRVPHLRALYKNDEKRFEEIAEQFRELFQFYKEKTLDDLRREYPLIKAKQKLMNLYKSLQTSQNSNKGLSEEGLNIGLNVDLSVIEKFVFIPSMCPKLTMFAVGKKFKIDISRGSVLISDLKSLQKDEIFETAVEAMKLLTKPKLIINCEDLGLDKIQKVAVRFLERKIDRRLAFVVDSELSLEGLDLDLNNDSFNFHFISSICPKLTMHSIERKFKVDIKRKSIKILDLESIKKDEIFESVLRELRLLTKLKLIIHCDDQREDEIKRISERFKTNKINQRIFFVYGKSCDSMCCPIIEYSWNHLTTDFRSELLKKEINFQGKLIDFGTLIKDPHLIKSIPINDFLHDKVAIAKPRIHNTNLTEKLIDRKFLPPNSKIIDEDDSVDDSDYDSENYTIEHDLDEHLTVTKEHQTILISDEPGMGKSTSFKMLHSKLSQKTPTLWLVFMDLKDHFKAYQDPCLEDRKREDIAKFFTEKVLIIESFEAEVFTQLFNEGRVVLFMDGLDEICPSYKQFIFSLMKDIQQFSKNQLWISTRPHLVAELRKELNPIEFALKPFTTANRREFFEKHFSGDPNYVLILKEIESFLLNLKRLIWGKSFCNPLVMRMIVEILDEDRSLKLSEANLFVVYDRFTRKMIEKCQDKGSEAKRDIANSFGSIVEFYQQQAFRTCFEGEDIASRREKLIDPQFDHVQKPPLDEIVRIGLMFESFPENLHFIHRTFAEFYVAKFFYEAIFKFTNLRGKKHLNATIEYLLKIVLRNYQINFVDVLLDNAIVSDKKLTVKKFPQSTLNIVRKKMKKSHFSFLVSSGCYNLIKFFVLHSHPVCQKLLFSRKSPNLVMLAVRYQSVDFIKRFFNLLKYLNADKLNRLLLEREEYNQNALSVAALKPNSEVFKYVFDFCKFFMKSNNLNKMLMQTYKVNDNSRHIDGNTNILHSAIAYDRHVDILIKVLPLKLSSVQQKTMLLLGVTYPDGNNLLQFALKNKNFMANSESLLAFIRRVLGSREINNFLLHKNNKGLTAFDLAFLNKSDLIFGAIKNFYLDAFGEDKMRKTIFDPNECKTWSQESSFYFRRCLASKWVKYECWITYHDGAFKRFISFIMELFPAESIQKEFFLIKDNDGKTLLEFAMKNFGKDDFAFICSLLNTNDQMEILQQMNSRDECAFHSSAELYNLESFRKIRDLYEENFNKETFRMMIVSCDKRWILDVVQCSMNKFRYKPSETFAELCHYLGELFQRTNETEKLKPFFQFADKEGRTAFMAAASSEHNEFVHLFALTKELYDVETIKEFLVLRDKYGSTALTCSFGSGSITSFEFVKSVYEELFKREKLREFVTATSRNSNILCDTIGWYRFSPDSFEKICNFLIKLFEGEKHKIKYFFDSVDHDKTVLMRAAEKSSYNCFKVLVDVIEKEKIFVEEEIVQMLCQTNLEGKTAFHFSIGNYDEEIFETVKIFYLKTLGNEALKNIISAKVDWTRVINEYILSYNIQRLVPVLKNLYTDVAFKNIFFKIFPEKRIKKSMKHKSNESNALLISYLKEQFQDDEEVKKFINKL